MSNQAGSIGHVPIFRTGWCKNGTYDASTGASVRHCPPRLRLPWRSTAVAILAMALTPRSMATTGAAAHPARTAVHPLRLERLGHDPAGPSGTRTGCQLGLTTVEICPSTTVAATPAFGMVASSSSLPRSSLASAS